MNIAILIDSLSGGGSENVAGRLSLGLAGRGHHVFIYCLKSANVAPDRFRAAGVVVREADSHGSDPTLLWRLGCWLRRDGIDVVQPHCCAGLVCSFPLAKLFNLPLLHVRHGWPLGRPSRYERFADRLSRYVDLVGINCASGRSRLPRGRVARDAVCLPNGFDCDEGEPITSRRRLKELCGRALPGPVILSAAYSRAEKGLRELVRGFALLRSDFPDADLVCVGGVIDQQYHTAVLREVHELKLDHCVHFPGPVEDAYRLMPGADVFCLASLTEALPNVIIEAMAQRVPIVSTAVGDVGSLPSVEQIGMALLEDHVSALLVPPNQPAALADALRETLRNPSAGRRRAELAYRKYQQDHTAARMVERYEAAYVECLRRRGKYTVRPVGRARCVSKPTVLMLGPAPPNVGGMVTSISLMMRSPLRAKYRLYRTNSPVSQKATGSPPAEGLIGKIAVTSAALFRHVAALFGFATTLIGQRVAIVHIHTCSYFTFYRNLLDLCVAKCLGRAVVLHIRGGKFEEFCETRGRLGRTAIRWGLQWADAVIVLSQSWLVRLRPYAGKAVLYAIPNACDPTTAANPRTSPRADIDRTDCRAPCRFLFLGGIGRAKGVGNLIEAARHLRQGGIAFTLQIAGTGQPTERDYWRQQVIRAGLADFVRFSGPVADCAKAELFSAADCLVHPSYLEGMPNVILEAGLAGLPVIASAVGAVPEMFDQMRWDGTADARAPLGILVPPRDSASLARAMMTVAGDVGLRRRIGARWQRKCQREYGLTQLAERIDRVYTALLEHVQVRDDSEVRNGKSDGTTPRSAFDSRMFEPHRYKSLESVALELGS